MKYQFAFAATLALASPAAFSQTTDQVIVTGVATPADREQVGNSLTVVDGAMIEAQGYNYVSDVLRQVPGLAVNRPGAIGGLTQVRIRGAEGNHTLVLLDGIDISSPDQGETDLSTVLTGDLARIEVLRGPQSGLYGSNALAGVVNLITRRDFDGHYVNASAKAGELGTFQVQGAGGWSDGVGYASLGFHMLSTDGFDVSPANAVPSVGAGSQPGDDEGLNIATVYLRAGRQVSDGVRLDGVARYVNKSADLDGQAFSPPISGLYYDDASDSQVKQYLLGGSATFGAGPWQTVAAFSWIDEQRRGTGTNFPFSFTPPTPAQLAAVPLEPNGADTARRKVSLQSTYTFGGPAFESRLTGFVENRKETFRNICPSTPSAPSFCSPQQRLKYERELTGYGLQYRAAIASQVYLSATARHDSNDSFKDADTYALAASWVIPNTGTRPHASWGTGVTNPTFTEQFGFDPGTFIGNLDLVPEESEGWDIGVEQTLMSGRLVLDLTYFESTLGKEIFTAFGSAPLFLSTPRNRTTDSDRSGWEASLRFEPTDNLDLVASYTNLDATEPAGIEIRRPEEQAALDASWRIGGGPLQLNAGVTYNGEQADTDFATFLNTRMDAYTLIRLGAAYQLTDRVELYGRIENLADEEYQEAIGLRGAPQAVYVGVRFRDGG